MSGKTAKILGARGEDVATAYLQSRGYRVIRRNYRAGRGEVDIIAMDGDVVVFVEVKSAIQTPVCELGARVNHFKRRRIISAASYYLCSTGNGDMKCRFDTVVVRFPGLESPPAVDLIRDSFGLDRMG